MLTVQQGKVAFLIDVIPMYAMPSPPFLPPLSVDHITALFISLRNTGLWYTEREPPTTRTVSAWSSAAVHVLKGSFECTDWGVFVDSGASTDKLADTVCDYINFCVECSIPQKTV